MYLILRTLHLERCEVVSWRKVPKDRTVTSIQQGQGQPYNFASDTQDLHLERCEVVNWSKVPKDRTVTGIRLGLTL